MSTPSRATPNYSPAHPNAPSEGERLGTGKEGQWQETVCHSEANRRRYALSDISNAGRDTVRHDRGLLIRDLKSGNESRPGVEWS